MGNQSGHELHADAAVFARRPTDKEMILLYHLQQKLFRRLVESPEHLAMLQRYWDASFGSKQPVPAFERHSACWRRDGGFSTENPADDLRGMGELGLACLLFFVETYPAEAAMMKRIRGGYPFVKAALAVARALCEVFRLVDEDSRVGRFAITRTLYWQLLACETNFYELFALLFLLFEELYCEEVAAHPRLQDEAACSVSVVAKLVDTAKHQLLRALVQAPMRVDDLRGLCANALHALNQRHEILAAHSIARTATPSDTTAPVSRWKQHETQRKSMREVCKNWREDATPRRRCRTYANSHSAGESLHRLQPRQPEISFSPPEPLTASLRSEQVAGTSGDGSDAPRRSEHDAGSDGGSTEPKLEASLFEGLLVAKMAATPESPCKLSESPCELPMSTCKLPVSPVSSCKSLIEAFVNSSSKAEGRHRRAASVG